MRFATARVVTFAFPLSEAGVGRIEDVIVDLLKQGLVTEAEILVDAATGMSSDNQSQQVRFFEKALSIAGGGVDETTLKLDMKKRVMSFTMSAMSIIRFPRFIERLLHTLNRIGNTTYSPGRVHRGNDRMRVEINIGK